jgi:hypothetical protein
MPDHMSSPEALIQELASDLRPVRRLAPPLLRALGWLAVVGALAVALACFADLGAMVRRLTAAPDMWLAVAGSTLTAILAAIAAFQTSLPDRKPAWALLPVPGLLLWVGASGLGCRRSWLLPGTHSADLVEARACLVFILAVSVPLSILLIVMLRRGYPLRPNLTAATGGLAAAAAAATLLNFFHPFDAAATDLAVHAGAVVLVVLANRALSGRVFRHPDV